MSHDEDVIHTADTEFFRTLWKLEGLVTLDLDIGADRSEMHSGNHCGHVTI